jgi:hypothetical protein
MRKIFSDRAFLLTLGACAFLATVPSVLCAQDLGPTLDLKPGQEVTLPVSIVDGKVKLGPARASKLGSGQPKDGEITVGVIKQGLSPYAQLVASEKTQAPVDFIATGLIGNIKIDEVRLCGRLDAPATTRIASGSWRVSLNRFAVRADGQECR